MIKIIIISSLFYLQLLGASFSSQKKIHESQISEIAKNIRCLVCVNESVESSNSEFAEDIKNLIRNKLKNGKSKNEIYSFLKSKYGDYVLFDPPFQTNTFILWVLPFMCLMFGFLIIKRFIKFKK